MESDSGSEGGEIEDEKSDFENHDTSERDGCYRPITSLEDELNLHTDGELNTGDVKTENIITENNVRRSNRESKQQSRDGGYIHPKFSLKLFSYSNQDIEHRLFELLNRFLRILLLVKIGH